MTDTLTLTFIAFITWTTKNVELNVRLSMNRNKNNYLRNIDTLSGEQSNLTTN